MKISEFIKEYDTCPICSGILDCIMYFELTHTISYKRIAEFKNEFQFLQVAEKNARKYQITLPHKTCADCSKMPQFFLMKDHFPLPEGLEQHNVFPTMLHGPRTGFAFVKVECARHDFSRYSTEFNIFSDNHDVEVYDESFDLTHDKTVINDYTNNETIIRVAECVKKMKLIPLNKWPLRDKAKLIEKLDRLLILM